MSQEGGVAPPHRLEEAGVDGVLAVPDPTVDHPRGFEDRDPQDDEEAEVFLAVARGLPPEVVFLAEVLLPGM